MAPPKRQKRKQRLEIGLEPEQYEAIEKLLKRRPDLGNNPTDFGRRQIIQALQRYRA